VTLFLLEWRSMATTFTVTVTDSGPSEKTITGEISAELFMSHWSEAVKELGKDAKIEGFRPGHIPEKVLVQHAGEQAILFEMAERTLATEYPKILTEHNIDAIGRPEITITKLAKDNPLGFAIKTAITPEVKLPDYKALAQTALQEKEEAVAVSDDEVESVLTELRTARKGKDEEELPALTDEFVKSVGNFNSVEELRTKIRENLTAEKESRARDKRRVKILDAISEKTDIAIPSILIHAEVDKMFSELRTNIEQMGLKLPDYLSHIKKTEEDLKNAWHEDAKKRVSAGLILSKIAHEEKLFPKEEEVSHEVAHLLEHYPDANPHNLRHYVEGQLANEKVLKFLEQK